jgi:hypothetical protein
MAVGFIVEQDGGCLKPVPVVAKPPPRVSWTGSSTLHDFAIVLEVRPTDDLSPS